MHWLKAQKGQRNQQLIRILESLLDSNQYSSVLLIKILDFFEWWLGLNQSNLEAFWVMSRFKSNFRNILSYKLIWMNSCKAIVSHELSQIKIFWDWVEKNQILSRTHVCSLCTPFALSSAFSLHLLAINFFFVSLKTHHYHHTLPQTGRQW